MPVNVVNSETIDEWSMKFVSEELKFMKNTREILRTWELESFRKKSEFLENSNFLNLKFEE